MCVLLLWYIGSRYNLIVFFFLLYHLVFGSDCYAFIMGFQGGYGDSNGNWNFLKFWFLYCVLCVWFVLNKIARSSAVATSELCWIFVETSMEMEDIERRGGSAKELDVLKEGLQKLDVFTNWCQVATTVFLGGFLCFFCWLCVESCNYKWRSLKGR